MPLTRTGAIARPSGFRWVTRNVDRHGKVRWRFRRKGYKTCYLPPPNAPNFDEAYADALKQKATPKSNPKHYSFNHAIGLYCASDAYKTLKPSTKEVYARILRRIGDGIGDKSIIALNRPALRDILDNIEKPTTRNRMKSLISILLDLAVDHDWIEFNVATTIKARKTKTTGFHCWTDRERAQFCAFWPSGTRERLAYALLFFTAQRGSDVVRMAAADMRDGSLIVTQQKTGAVLNLPIADELRTEIEKVENWKDKSAFLTTMAGNPMGAKVFQQWFSAACTKAGLPHCSAHGLRKARATFLANNNATASQIMAVTGHKTLGEAQKYVNTANQARLAAEAMKNSDQSVGHRFS